MYTTKGKKAFQTNPYTKQSSSKMVQNPKKSSKWEETYKEAKRNNLISIAYRKLTSPKAKEFYKKVDKGLQKSVDSFVRPGANSRVKK